MFTPFRLGEMVVQNRVVVSPMNMYSAKPGGIPGDFHLVHLGGLAMGGAGLVFAEMTAVSEAGRITPGCPGIYTAAQVAAWKRISDFVHRAKRSQVLPAARTLGPQGVDQARLGRHGPSARGGKLGADCGVAAGVLRFHACAARDHPQRDGSRSRRLRAGCAQCRPCRLRYDRGACRPRLSALRLYLAAEQRAHGPVWRQPREPHALSARSV